MKDRFCEVRAPVLGKKNGKEFLHLGHTVCSHSHVHRLWDYFFAWKTGSECHIRHVQGTQLNDFVIRWVFQWCWDFLWSLVVEGNWEVTLTQCLALSQLSPPTCLSWPPNPQRQVQGIIKRVAGEKIDVHRRGFLDSKERSLKAREPSILGPHGKEDALKIKRWLCLCVLALSFFKSSCHGVA